MPLDVKVLGESAYGTALAIAPDGVMGSFNHLASVAFDEGQMDRAFVKTYDPATKGIINEITGLFLAEALGLPTPKKAAILLLTDDFIRKNLLSTYPKPLVPTTIPFLATSEISGGTPKQYYFSAHGKMREILQNVMRIELKEWSQFPLCVAFDEWLAHSDRNTGNLIRLQKNEFALIDHGELLTGQAWTADSLNNDHQHEPNLKLFTFIHGDPPYSPDDCSKVLVATDRLGAAFEAAEVALNAWWGVMMTAGEVAAVTNFVGFRAQQSKQRVAKTLRMLA